MIQQIPTERERTRQLARAEAAYNKGVSNGMIYGGITVSLALLIIYCLFLAPAVM